MASQESLWSQNALKPTSQCSSSKSHDLSLLRLPIETTVTGLKQAFSVLVNGHHDVANLLVSEANVIYECSSCLNFFRCISSFISHKRSFCPKRSSIISSFHGENGISVPPVVVAQVSTQNVVRLAQEPEDLGLKIPEFDLNDYSPSLGHMKDLGILKQSGVKKSLEAVVQSIHSGGKNNNHNDNSLENLNSSFKQPTKKLNFAAFYHKRCNRKSKTVVLDPLDMVKRNRRSSSNIYPCPKCERHFSSVKKTREHLSRAHFFTRRHLDSHNQWILDSKQPSFKSIQNNNHEALTKRVYAVNLKKDPSIEGSAELKNILTSKIKEKSIIEEPPPRPWAKLFHSYKSPQWHLSSPTLQIPTNQNSQNSSTPSIVKTVMSPEREQSADSNASENLNSVTGSSICTLTKPSSPSTVLEKFADYKILKPNEEKNLLNGRTLQISPSNQSLVNAKSKLVSLSSYLPEKTENVIANSDHFESRKSKRKQTNPTSVLRSQNPIQEAPPSLLRNRKQSKPTHALPIVNIK